MTGRRILLFVATGIVSVGVVIAAGYFVLQQRIKGQIEDGLRHLAANPPAPYRAVVYERVEFSLSDRRVVVTGLKAEPGANGDSISIGRLELERFDADAWEEVVGPDRTAASGAKFRRLFDRAIFSDIAVNSGGQPAKADKLTIGGVESRPFPSQALPDLRALSPAERAHEILSYARIDALVIENFTGLSGGRELAFSRGEVLGLRDGRFKSLAFDKLNHDQPDGRFSFGRFEVRDGLSAIWFSPIESKTADQKLSYFDFAALKVVDLRKGDSSSGQNAVTFGSIEIGPVNRTNFESAKAKEVSVIDRTAASPITLAVAQIELRDLHWEMVLPILAGLIESDDRRGNTDDGLQAQLEKLRTLRYSLGKLSFTGMDFGPGITLAEAKVQFRNDNGAGEADVDLSDLTLKAAELRDREMSAGLAGFGYSTLTLSLRMRVTGNYQAGTGALESFEIFGPQVGKLSTSYSVSNYRELGAGRSDPMAQLLAANIDRAEISWQDDGLTQRLLAAAARQQRTSIATLRAGLAAQLRQAMLPYQNSKRMGDLADALAGYLEKPGVLRVAARPSRPVPIAAVAQILDVPPGVQPDLPALFDLLSVESSTR